MAYMGEQVQHIGYTVSSASVSGDIKLICIRLPLNYGLGNAKHHQWLSMQDKEILISIDH